MTRDGDQVTIADLKAALKKGRAFRGRDVEILCDSVEAIRYRDVLDLYLSASGVGTWRWIDGSGGRTGGRGVLPAAGRLTLDVLGWPLVYLRQLGEVGRLERDAPPIGGRSAFDRVVFLRTDHWFNIRSGGSVGHLAGVIAGLRGLGHEVSVVSSDRLARVPDDPFFHLCRPAYGRGRNIPEIPELLDNENVVSFVGTLGASAHPDWIYQRYSLGNYAGVALKRRLGVPFVCEYNGSFPWMARNWDGRRLLHEKLLTRIEFLNLRAADLVVVVSAAMKNELCARGIAADKILVNPNGVDVELYSPAIDGSEVRRRHGLLDKLVIGFIGTFGPWHGAEVLADAFGIMLRSDPSLRDAVRLLMVGDGATLPEVKRRLDAAGVNGQCVLTGRVPQEAGPAHLAACDVLASPHVGNPDGTPFFGSPTKLFEYMATGKAIVASDLDQIGEILSDRRTAIMVRPGDPAALAAALREVLLDARLRDVLGRGARVEAAGKYSWKEHTKRTVAALKERTGR